jgi:hypothetical protein
MSELDQYVRELPQKTDQYLCDMAILLERKMVTLGEIKHRSSLLQWEYSQMAIKQAAIFEECMKREVERDKL